MTKIRKPSWKDARKVSKEIRIHNKNNPNMIERMPRDIKNSSFWIAQNKWKKILGFVGIFNWEQEGIEIVSHLVLKKFQKLGIGEKLLMQAIKKAKKQNSNIFLFTTEISYYEKYGFEVVDAKKFPKKIRIHCQKCLKGPHGPGFEPCKEKAMRLNLWKKTKPSESRLWMFPYFG